MSGRALDSRDNLESVLALKWVGLSMITINLGATATAITKQLSYNRTSVYRVLR